MQLLYLLLSIVVQPGHSLGGLRIGIPFRQGGMQRRFHRRRWPRWGGGAGHQHGAPVGSGIGEAIMIAGNIVGFLMVTPMAI